MADLSNIPMIYKCACILSRAGISAGQFLALKMCMEGNPTMTELSRALRCSTAAVTGLMDRLEKLNLVTREFSMEDRRVVRASITQAGSGLMADLDTAFDKF